MTPKEIAAAYGFTTRTLRNKLKPYWPLFSKAGNKIRKRFFTAEEMEFIQSKLGRFNSGK